jgi:urea carboxylase
LLAIIESMKMEFPVHASTEGIVAALKAKEGQQINAGQTLLMLDPLQEK